MSEPRINIIGKKYGKLTILKLLERIGRSKFLYEAICDCGTILNVKVAGSKCRKSCDKCQIRPVLKPGFFRTETPDYLSTLRNRYKRGAIERNLCFELSKEQFEELIFGECYYCGSKQQSKQMYNKRQMVYYTGIDRVDNKIGYTYDNCVSCCKECNIVKKSVTVEIIIKAYEFLKEKGKLCQNG